MAGVTLLTVLLATVLSYRTFEQKLTERMHEKSLQLLAQTRSVFSSIHSTYIPYFIQLSKDPWISKLMYGRDIEIKYLLEGMESLNRAILSRPYLHSIVVYNYREQMIYTSDKGPIPVPDFYDQELISILHNVKRYGFYKYLPRKIRPPGVSRRENVFTIIVGFPPINRDQSLGALIFNISEDDLRGHLFSNLADSEPFITITSRDGVILSHPDPELFGGEAWKLPYLAASIKEEENSGIIQQDLDGKSFWVSYLREDVMGWHFVSLTPSSNFTQQLGEYRNQIIIVALLIIVVVLLVDYLMSRTLSKPIERLFKEAKELQKAVISEDIRFDSEGNPTSSQKRVGEIEGLRQILESTRLRMKRVARVEVVAALHSVLEGRSAFTDDDEQPPELLDFLSKGKNRPIVILIDKAFYLRARYGADYLASVRSIIESLIPEIFSAEALTVDMGYDQLVVILSETELNQKAELEGELRNLQKQVRTKLDCTISIGIGAEESEYVLLREGYQRAQDRALHRFKTGYNSILFTGSFSKESKTLYRFPPEEDLRFLVDLMLLGKKDEAIQRGRNIIYSVQEGEYADFVLMIQLLTYYLYRLLSSRLEHNPDLGRNFELLAKDHRWADTLKSVDDYLTGAISFFIREQTVENQTRQREIVKKVKQYIDNNLANLNLSSNGIADMVGLSTNYLRMVFKKQSSESLSDYINCRRIDWAKRYLEEGKYSVKDVAEHCGFSNYTYFFTLFKKKTGQTPKQYYEKNRDTFHVSSG